MFSEHRRLNQPPKCFGDKIHVPPSSVLEEVRNALAARSDIIVVAEFYRNNIAGWQSLDPKQFSNPAHHIEIWVAPVRWELRRDLVALAGDLVGHLRGASIKKTDYKTHGTGTDACAEFIETIGNLKLQLALKEGPNGPTEQATDIDLLRSVTLIVTGDYKETENKCDKRRHAFV